MPSLLLPSNLTAVASSHPTSKSIPFFNFPAKPSYRLTWKNPAQWDGLIRRLSFQPSLSIAAAFSADFRSPDSCSPVQRVPELLFAEESRNKLVNRNGESAHGSASEKNVGSFWSFLPKIARILAILLLGLGVVSTLRLPALAKPETAEAGAGVARTVGNSQILEVLSSCWAGLAAGCLHTLTGPDHLAVLAPLCLGRPRLESALVGAWWGLGHDAGQVIFGLVFLLLKDKLHLELVRVWSARVVGVTLLAIGAVGLKEAQELQVSALVGEGAGPAPDSVGDVKSSTKGRVRTFATGIVYGLQPDALIVILPALALPSRLAGAAFLGMFLIGTVIAMGSYTAFIASCGQALEKRLPSVTRRLTIGSSFVAIAFGLCVLVGEFFGFNPF